MGRVNLPCNLTPEEQAAAYEEFNQSITDDEIEQIIEVCDNYLIYDRDGRNGRDCTCTHVNCGSFGITRRENPGFFRHHHGEQTECPRCGQRVKLISMGKMGNFSSLRKNWTHITLCRSGKNGALLLMSGYAYRYYGWNDLRPLPEVAWKTWTYLKPGKRMQWAFYSYGCTGIYHQYIEKRERVREPFTPQYYYDDGSSYFLNTQAILNTDLRYCQLEDWCYDAFGQSLNLLNEPVRGAVKYLSAYTQYPSIEMAVKIGMSSAVSDLALYNKKGGKHLDWKANTMQDFLKMDKQDCKAFLKASGGMELLQAYHRAKQHSLVKNMQEYIQIIESSCGLRRAEKLTTAALKAGCTIRVAANYVEKDFNTHTRLTMWIDYLDMAKALGYDLSRKDVVMPKDLQDRHDAAAETLKYEEKQIQTEKRRKLNEKIQKMYEFSYGDMCIVAPDSVSDIIREGKVLRHCVGGYAARHFAGETVILFLRHRRKPGTPYITIELDPRKTAKAKVRIRQIHGYRNECYGNYKHRPEEKYAWFLTAWKQWLLDGSRRNKAGKPIIDQEETA